MWRRVHARVQVLHTSRGVARACHASQLGKGICTDMWHDGMAYGMGLQGGCCRALPPLPHMQMQVRARAPDGMAPF